MATLMMDITGETTTVQPELSQEALIDKARYFLIFCDICRTMPEEFTTSDLSEQQLIDAIAARADFEVNLLFTNGIYFASWAPRG